MKDDGRGKPFYARVRVRGRVIESTHYATAGEAGAAFDRMSSRLREPVDNADTGEAAE